MKRKEKLLWVIPDNYFYSLRKKECVTFANALKRIQLNNSFMFSRENRANTIHGILLIALFSCSAFYIAEIPFVKSLSFSPLIVGIILGMIYANSLRNRLPETWVPRIKF